MAEINNNYWIHRITGGENGKLLSIPLLNNHGLLSIGWSFLSTNERLKDIRENGIKAIDKAYKEEGATPTKSRSCLKTFIYDMKKGDIVVVPNNAFFSVYRITDNEILTNENIPNEYLEENNIQRKNDGIYTLDGEYVDLGFYRHVELVVTNLLRSTADEKLYAKMRTLRTNLKITSVRDSVDAIINQNKVQKPKKRNNKRKEGIITDFHVKNYKNLSNLDLSGLRRLNLFVGANNTGKSNLLEALFLYASNFSHEHLVEILRRRKENMEYFDGTKHFFRESEYLTAFAPFFPKRSVDKMMNNTFIELGTDEKGYLRYTLMAATFRLDKGITRLTRLTPYGNLTNNQKLSNNIGTVLVTLPRENESTGITSQKSSFENIMHLTRISNSGIEIQSTNTDYLYKCQLVNCKQLSTQKAENIWSRISLTEMEKVILKALKIIDERTKDFNFIRINSNTYQPTVVLEGEDYKMPLSEMGDGMTHVLNIILALLDCANGILLLDEAESGLHYKTQSKLWEMIFDLANEYKVQVFATTHSNDCIKAFAESSIDHANDGLVVRLESNGNGVDPIYYTNSKSVVFAINNNFETR